MLRGTAGRPQGAILLRKAYIRPIYKRDGSKNGFNIFFPKVDQWGREISLKGHKDDKSRWKVMPETLVDDMPIAMVLRDFLDVAPDDTTGPLFQKVDARGAWCGTPWTVADITKKLQDALRDPRIIGPYGAGLG